MIKVVQVNLNYYRNARDLLQQFVREESVSVLVSDPYPFRTSGWYTDLFGLASMGVALC